MRGNGERLLPRSAARRGSFPSLNVKFLSSAPFHEAEPAPGLVCEPVDDGWPTYEEPTYDYH